MYILNGLASIFRFAYDGIRALFSPYEQAGEAEDAAPLLHQQSLTSTFKDFETSAGAVRLCVLHTFTYYILVVLCFSCLLEKWPVVDSLYFATVLVRPPFGVREYGNGCRARLTSQISLFFLIC
jgi:hypothetical protein